MSSTISRSVGTPVERLEGRDKVQGLARYAFEHHPQGAAYAVPVRATIARGTVRRVDADAALAVPGVLAVLWHGNAPRLGETDDRELALFQDAVVAYRGQIIAAVVADSLETASEVAATLAVEYAPEPHDVVLRTGHPRLFRPEKVNPTFPTDTDEGDFDAAYAQAAVRIDETYETPAEHNHPLEPHATTAQVDGDRITVYDSNQGSDPVKQAIAKAFEVPPERVRVMAQHVGGGFGSKGTPKPNVILAVMAAKVTGRPVKLALSRHALAAVAGYRTPTIQRVRLGASADGRLQAICHDVVEQTSTLRVFAEQTAVVTRMLYAGENRRTTHRVARLDVPTPSWMRAPGECPGMYALECAMDELALAAGLDPIELRVRNEPEVDPESGHPFSSRNLVACLREGAARFGWDGRDPAPAARRDGRWLVGTGVASSTYPARRRPAKAFARQENGGFVVGIDATDIGTGARTVLTQIAADALDVPLAGVQLELGDSDLPAAGVAGGSMGTSSWGFAVVKACRALRDVLERGEGREVHVDTAEDGQPDPPRSRHAFGAQFVEVRVNVDTGEVRVPRMLGVFAAGRILNPRTARSQLIGGMTMGLSMALFEESLMDAQFGDYVNHDLASYHIATHADVPAIEVDWIEEDEDLNPMGAKGVGEIGIVGTAAAVANAVHHATGIRLRELPLRPDRLLERL
jgi:xanthine dehydrogenase YagR molybdenum-binding subunit